MSTAPPASGGVRLVASPRTEFGKGAARRVRRSGFVPAVLYGHGQDPRHVSLPGHDLMIALRGDANQLLTLEIDGGTELALPRAIVRDPIKGFLEHLDLLLVRRGEKVTIDLAISTAGESAPGSLPELQLQVLSVEADATALPDPIVIDVNGLTAGTVLTAGEVRLAEGTTLIGDPTQIVLTIAGDTMAAELAADEEAAAADQDTGASTPDGEGDVVPDSESDAGGPGGAPSGS